MSEKVTKKISAVTAFATAYARHLSEPHQPGFFCDLCNVFALGDHALAERADRLHGIEAKLIEYSRYYEDSLERRFADRILAAAEE